MLYVKFCEHILNYRPFIKLDPHPFIDFYFLVKYHCSCHTCVKQSAKITHSCFSGQSLTLCLLNGNAIWHTLRKKKNYLPIMWLTWLLSCVFICRFYLRCCNDTSWNECTACSGRLTCLWKDAVLSFKLKHFLIIINTSFTHSFVIWWSSTQRRNLKGKE